MAALLEGLASITHAARNALSRSTPSPPHEQKLRVSLRHGSTVEGVRAYFLRLLDCLQRVNYPHTIRDIRRLMTCRVEEVYSVGRELGRGHFGKVRECRDRSSGEFFACKTVRLAEVQRPNDWAELQAEVMTLLDLQEDMRALQDASPRRFSLLSALESDEQLAVDPLAPVPGVVRLHELCFDGSALHIVMDHCAGGDLFDHVTLRGRLQEAEAAQIFQQLCRTVLALHRRGVVHRDIKPENILLMHPTHSSSSSSSSSSRTSDSSSGSGGDRSSSSSSSSSPVGGSKSGRYFQFQGGRLTQGCTVRLVDFGLAVCVRGGRMAQGLAGSPYYIAPEIIQGQLHACEVDVWSLGVLLYVCLTGKLPFYGNDNTEVFRAVLEAQPDMEAEPWPELSIEVRNLTLQMLMPDPRFRIPMAEVVRHPWFQLHAVVERPLSPWQGFKLFASCSSSSVESRAGEGRKEEGGRTPRGTPPPSSGKLSSKLFGSVARALSSSRAVRRDEVEEVHDPVVSPTIGGVLVGQVGPTMSMPQSTLASSTSGCLRVWQEAN